MNYLHVVRIYNQSADYLAGDAFAKKAERVDSGEEELKTLEGLNRLAEVVYLDIDEPEKVESGVSTTKLTSSTDDRDLVSRGIRPHVTNAKRPTSVSNGFDQ